MQVNQADLAHCAKERIEIPECVQHFGGLLVCDPTSSRILRHTAGACRLLERDALLGQCLADLMPLLMPHWHRLSEQPPLVPVRINHLTHEGRTLDIQVHAVPAHSVWVVELFPAHDMQETFQLESALFEQMSDAINKLRALTTLSDFWTRSSDLLRNVLGYERVMIYRFDADGSGQVIAESTAEGVPVKYLHLHFPGSDIPAQARVLYERNLLRVIADVDAEPEPLLGAATEPLDQSLCLLRQPSPLHLQYLRNMGVRATLTVSLLQEGKLWGMLACHHPEPRVPPQHLSRSLLVACNLLGLAFNIQVSSLLHIEKLQQDKALLEQLDTLARQLRKLEDWEQWRKEISRFFSQQLPLAQLDVARLPATSDGLLHQGIDVSSPPHEAWLHVPGGQGFDGFAIHMVKAPDETDWMWAGDPNEHEPMALKDGQVVLGPRESFGIWREHRARHPLPWTGAEQLFLERTQRLLHEALQQHLVRRQEEQLALLGAALQQSREMIIISTADKDPDTGNRRIIYINNALLAGTLYERDELMGRSPSMFQGPETDPLVVQRISRQLTAGEPVAETLRNYKKNGQPHWLDLRIHPLRNIAGKITHFVSVQRDVTQQLESLEQLHQQNAFLTRLTELLPGAVFVFRRSAAANYSFDFTTEVFQSLFGIASLSPSQAAFIQAIHDDDLTTVLDSIERSAQTLSRWRHRFRVRAQKGHGYRTLEGFLIPSARTMAQ